MVTRHPEYAKFKTAYRKTAKELRREIIAEKIAILIFCISLAVAFLTKIKVPLELPLITIAVYIGARQLQLTTRSLLKMQQTTTVMAEFVTANTLYNEWYFSKTKPVDDGVRRIRRKIVCDRMFARIAKKDTPTEVAELRTTAQNLLRNQQATL